ncbi:FAD dependent oxidoreductase [Bisporella sp. PMI_857]|nr:FAD dependent oxidoreductase [Bisporella sp. PMI_857]
MTTQASTEVKNVSILIVGAGVFGLSTALELSSRGYSNITVVDRYLAPVPDGSSVDISRIIRTDYADPLYAKIASEARDGWISTYKEFYFRCGLIQLSETKGHVYVEKCKEMLRAKDIPFIEFEDAKDVVNHCPGLNGHLAGMSGYMNPQGGWADAGRAIQSLAARCSLAGVSFITGRRGTVVSLLKDGNIVSGVNVISGPPIVANQVILATGAWTSRILDISKNAISTGQPVGFIQLTPEEAERIKDLPVCINMSTGFFCFPPTMDTHILKVARHGFGYQTQIPVDQKDAKSVSSPLRDSNNTVNPFLPDDAEKTLRDGLKLLLPDFANHPWMHKRLCWYTDTPEGDFIVDHHPTYKGLFLATGGSGHAFKFLPVLGRYISDCFEDVAPAELRKKWAFGAEWTENNLGDGSRGGPPRRVLSVLEQSKL